MEDEEDFYCEFCFGCDSNMNPKENPQRESYPFMCEDCKIRFKQSDNPEEVAREKELILKILEKIKLN